jgi:Flp pilus assembly protein TadG
MTLLRKYLRRRDGTSAIEFAIIAPVLAILTIYGFDAWQLINRKEDMHAAINASAHYYMGGGGDDSTASTIGMNGWPNTPGDANISISRACTCAGGGSDCNTVCAATQQAPETRVTIRATDQWTGLHPAALSESETIRVR